MVRSLAKLSWGIVLGSAALMSLPVWPMCAGRALAAVVMAKDSAKLKQAKQLYKEGQYEDAAKIFASLSIEYPDKLAFTRNLGACYYHLRRPEPAISNLSEYLKRGGNFTKEDRTEVEGWIAEMEKLRDQTASVPSEPSVIAAAPHPVITSKQEWHSMTVPRRGELRSNLAQEKTLPDAVGAALRKLTQKTVAPSQSVLLYNITYADEGLPSPMGRYLENLALTSASSARLFTVYSRAKFDTAVKAKGASIGDLKGEPVDFVLSGTFFLTDEDLRVFLKLARASDGAEKAETGFKIDRRSLPVGIDMAPPSQTEAAKASLASLLQEGSNTGLKVAVFPDRGKGGGYRDGEQMVIVVKANKDCFVKVFMTTADGKTVLVFPNKYDLSNRLVAGKARLLGEEGDRFKFNITKPYGLETLKVIASTEQFKDYDQLAVALNAGMTFDMIAVENRDTVTKYMTRGIAVTNNTGTAQVAEDSSAYSALSAR
jgi:Domain of unknown function (DUF4384)